MAKEKPQPQSYEDMLNEIVTTSAPVYKKVIAKQDATKKEWEKKATTASYDDLMNDVRGGVAAGSAGQSVSPDTVQGHAQEAQILHTQEAVKLDHNEYLKYREQFRHVDPEQLAEAAEMADRREQYFKSRPKTASEFAALDSERQSFQPFTGELINKPDQMKTQFADVAYGLAKFLDTPHRFVYRTPGKWLVRGLRAGKWSPGEAWDATEAGWADELIVAGVNKWIAYPVGMGLELVTDPFLATGAGAGLKRSAALVGHGPIDDLTEMALKAGTHLPGKTKAQIGIYLRSAITGKRNMYGIPGSEILGNHLAKAQEFASKYLRSPRSPLSGYLKTIHHGMSEEAGAEAAYAMNRAMNAYIHDIGELGLSTEARKRSVMASEYIKHARDGEVWAERAITDITFSEAERIAAGKLHDGWDAVNQVVKTFGLDIDTTGGHILKKRKEIQSLVESIEVQSAKKTRGAVRAAKRATSAESLATSLGDIGKAKPDDALKMLGKYSTKLERQAKSVAKKSGLTAEREGLESLGKIRGSRNWPKKYRRAAADKMDVLQKELSEKLSTPAGAYREAFKAEEAATELSGVVKSLSKMHPEELAQTLKKTVSLNDITSKGGKLPNVTHEIQGIYNAQSYAAKQAKVAREVAQNRMTVADAYKASKEHKELLGIVDQIDRGPGGPAHLGRITARNRDKAVSKAIKDFDVFSSSGSKSGVSILGKSGASKSRIWKTERGTDKYLWDVEREFRGTSTYNKHFAADPSLHTDLSTLYEGVTTEAKAISKGRAKLAGKNNESFKAYIQDLAGGKELVGDTRDEALRVAYHVADGEAANTSYLTEMFGTADPLKQAAKMDEMIKAGDPIVGRFFELDPNLSIGPALNRTVLDVENKTMKEGLRLLASDIKSPANSIHVDTIAKAIGGGEVAEEIAKMYKGKYFPKEVLEEIHDWSNALSQSFAAGVLDNTMGKGWDKLQNIWKVQATGLWPSFHFRNMVSDLFRAATLGPYNPAAVYRDGLRAVGKKGVVDLGEKLGKRTGQELWDLAKAYRVTGGYYDEMGTEFGKIWKAPIKLMSGGEDVRRVGFFADQIRKGYKPIEASRRTNKVFFDYKNLAPWEKGLAKRMIPFWTFRRNNIAFQVEKLLSQPWFTAAQFRALRGRKTLYEAGQGGLDASEMPDWVPDRLQGNMGLITREGGITSVLYGMGFDAQDLVGLLDAAGHPKGALHGVFSTLWDERSPLTKPEAWQGTFHLGKFLPELVGFGGFDPMAESNAKLTKAPNGAEKLPDSWKSKLGIRKEKIHHGYRMGHKRYREQWMMPEGSKAMMRTWRVFSEVMKWARVDRTQEMSDVVMDGLVGTFTGLSDRQITDAQAREMLIFERLSDLRTQVADKGYIDKKNKLTKRGRNTILGREYEKASKAYGRALKERIREEDKKRNEEQRAIQD